MMGRRTPLVIAFTAGPVILGLAYTAVLLISRRLVGRLGYPAAGALCFGIFAWMLWPEIYAAQPERTWSTLLFVTILMMSWATVPIALLLRLEARAPHASLVSRFGHGVGGFWLATVAGFVAGLPVALLGMWLNW